MIRHRIESLLKEAVKTAFPDVSIGVEVSESDARLGSDFSSSVAFLLAKHAGKKPADCARLVVQCLATVPWIQSITVAPNGYINFVLDNSLWQEIISSLARQEVSDLIIKETHPPKMMIEFVSANPTGPLHIGHGRGAALGDSLFRIFKALGYPVDREYYINDVGVQMQHLANSVRARSEQRKNPQTPFPENGYKGEYISAIAEKMEQENRTDFDQFPRAYILDGIREDLKLFRVQFENWFSEEQLHRADKIESTIEKLRARHAILEKDGAIWFASQTHSEEDDKDRVLKKSDGRATYFAADIAYHENKFERGYQRCLDIWGHDHHGYVPRVKGAIEVLGHNNEALTILLYQLVSLKREGKKVPMSTRSGEFVTLREILEEVGADACRFFFALRSPNSQLEFDVDLAKKQSNENPVFYVQYVHARIASIFREAQARGVQLADPAKLPAHKWEPAEIALARKLTLFGDVLASSAKNLTPHLLANYLLELATAFHKFYDQCRVLDAADSARQLRLSLLRATQKTVHYGLELLGVSAPEKM